MLNFFKKIVTLILPKSWFIFLSDLLRIPRKLEENQKNIHTLATLILEPDKKDLKINGCELKFHSQHGEDGILQYIFSKIGTTNRFFVEFGFGDGRECNTANLSLNLGWQGLLMDCDKKKVLQARYYYQKALKDKLSKVTILANLVTAENINEILLKNNIKGEIDLLSIDIDGNDYWVWQAITVIKPRVVVIEYNASFGLEKALTVKYDPDFKRYKKDPRGFYFSASLAALTKLANSKGYVLIGCDSSGTNAFYVLKETALGKFPELSLEEAYFPSAAAKKLGGQGQDELIRSLDLESV